MVGTAVHLGEVKAHPSLIARRDEHMLPGILGGGLLHKRTVFLQQVFCPDDLAVEISLHLPGIFVVRRQGYVEIDIPRGFGIKPDGGRAGPIGHGLLFSLGADQIQIDAAVPVGGFPVIEQPFLAALLHFGHHEVLGRDHLRTQNTAEIIGQGELLPLRQIGEIDHRRRGFRLIAGGQGRGGQCRHHHNQSRQDGAETKRFFH